MVINVSVSGYEWIASQQDDNSWLCEEYQNSKLINHYDAKVSAVITTFLSLIEKQLVQTAVK